jgi:hypothetical protein
MTRRKYRQLAVLFSWKSGLQDLEPGESLRSGRMASFYCLPSTFTAALVVLWRGRRFLVGGILSGEEFQRQLPPQEFSPMLPTLVQGDGGQGAPDSIAWRRSGSLGHLA